MPLNNDKDWLLTAARGLLALMIGLLLLTMALVAFGALAVVTFRRSENAARIAEAGYSGSIGVWGIFLGLLAVCGLLFLALRFAIELSRIVKSVGEGDPFVPANAERLSRMGWFALVVCLGSNAMAAARTHFERVMGSTDPSENLTGSLVGGIALVLTLFILARVFRKGTEMRGDLEGTV